MTFHSVVVATALVWLTDSGRDVVSSRSVQHPLQPSPKGTCRSGGRATSLRRDGRSGRLGGDLDADHVARVRKV
jgi:hypothetical protein